MAGDSPISSTSGSRTRCGPSWRRAGNCFRHGQAAGARLPSPTRDGGVEEAAVRSELDRQAPGCRAEFPTTSTVEEYRARRPLLRHRAWIPPAVGDALPRTWPGRTPQGGAGHPQVLIAHEFRFEPPCFRRFLPGFRRCTRSGKADEPGHLLNDYAVEQVAHRAGRVRVLRDAADARPGPAAVERLDVLVHLGPRGSLWFVIGPPRRRFNDHRTNRCPSRATSPRGPCHRVS